MQFRSIALALLLTAASGMACADPAPEAVAPAAEGEALESTAREVEGVERGFARTMADRDLGGFAAMVADDAVFRSDKGLLVGREAVLNGWRHLFADGPAPFSWEPDKVTVSQSGDTALSTGPVFDREGHRVARFTSVWRRQAGQDGQHRWRIIVDQGVPIDACR
jgi:ketosteroid isomerase-like protein